MRSLAIVGVGLIGGSLGLALRKAGFQGQILGVSSERSLAAAIARGAIDSGATLEEASGTADVLYLAQPISGILSTIDRLAPLLRPGPLVTDAGSTKVEIVARARTALGADRFLGGHPMAGKAARGVEEADPDLFRNRVYVCTPAEGQAAPHAGEFLDWLRRCGASIVTMSPEEHDRTVAVTSHLPQLLSTALARVVAGEVAPDRFAISGPGLQDMTRLALSSWDVWGDILSTNRVEVDHALNVYIDKLTEMRDTLRSQALDVDFRIAAHMAGLLRR